MTSVAFPFLRIVSDNINASPWLVAQDGGPEGVLGDRIEKWDYISKIQLTRSISLDFAGVANDLGIEPSRLRIAVLTTMGTGGVRGERSKQILSNCKISAEASNVSISVEPLSAELSQTIKLSTEVILDAPATGGRLSPKLRGMRLWSDTQTVHVEPSSARFPVEASSFQKLFKDHAQGAFFHLSLTAPDWEQDFSNSVRLYINSDEAEFCRRFSAGDDTVLRLVMSAIINQLVRRGLSNEAFSLDVRSSLPTSISGIVRNWIVQAFPNQSLETVKIMSEYNAAMFEKRACIFGGGANGMTDRLLFPRLNDIGVQQLLPADGKIDTSILDLQIESAPPFISWAATGGRRIKTNELLAIRNSVLKIAAPLGFPKGSTQVERAQFDAECSSFLLEGGAIPTGEALRDDVWAYVATILLPDVCLWRFPSPPKERFFGGVRNTFQRLWLRARAFDRGSSHPSRWELLSQLSEDAMVQITERPSVAADPRLALTIAECWLKTANKAGKSRMEDITRNAVRNLRIANEVLYFAALDERMIESATLEYFDKAAGARA